MKKITEPEYCNCKYPNGRSEWSTPSEYMCMDCKKMIKPQHKIEKIEGGRVYFDTIADKVNELIQAVNEMRSR